MSAPALPGRPRGSSDVRDLAQVLKPDLPDFSLETLAAWLGIAVVERHRALPDAKLAAEVFLALLPRLRENSIRTLAEAEDACRKLSASPGVAGWHEAALPPSGPVRVDSYPYRHRARDVMSKPPQFAAPSMSIREALALLVRRKVSSLFIARSKPEAPPGIVTERDILRAIAREGAKAFAKPVKSIATFPLESVSEEDFLLHRFRAHAPQKIPPHGRGGLARASLWAPSPSVISCACRPMKRWPLPTRWKKP